MSLKSAKSNLGYLIAGAILFGVAVNIYLEFNTKGGSEPECRSILIP
jgi:hypothetical protein